MAHIKYNSVMYIMYLQISSISFFSLRPPIYGTIWVTHTHTDGHFCHPSVTLTDSHIHTVQAVLLAHSIMTMMMMIVYAIQIHCVCGSISEFAPIWPTCLDVCYSVSILGFSSITCYIYIYFIIILFFMISIRSNWINKNKLIFSGILFAS